MAQVSATQQMILDAISNYSNGSAGLVRAFEAVAKRYYNEDSHSCDNLTFYVNSLSSFPKMQAALIRVIRNTKPATALFAVKVSQSDEGKYVVANMKGDKAKELKEKCQANLEAFIGQGYTSLMNIEGEAKKTKPAVYDRDATVKALRGAVERQITNMLAANPEMDLAVLNGLVTEALNAALDATNVEKLKAKMAENK